MDLIRGILATFVALILVGIGVGAYLFFALVGSMLTGILVVVFLIFLVAVGLYEHWTDRTSKG